jgi:hypothetical protein
MIVSALTLDERLRRAQRESERLTRDMKDGHLRNPYKIIVDCVVNCSVTRDLISDQQGAK